MGSPAAMTRCENACTLVQPSRPRAAGSICTTARRGVLASIQSKAACCAGESVKVHLKPGPGRSFSTSCALNELAAVVTPPPASGNAATARAATPRIDAGGRRGVRAPPQQAQEVWRAGGSGAPADPDLVGASQADSKEDEEADDEGHARRSQRAIPPGHHVLISATTSRGPSASATTVSAFAAVAGPA